MKTLIPKFSLENLSFSLSEFLGTSKFPVNGWLSLDESNIHLAVSSSSTFPKSYQTMRLLSQTVILFNSPQQPQQPSPVETELLGIMKINDETNGSSIKFIKYKSLISDDAFFRKTSICNLEAGNGKKGKKQRIKEIVYESKNIKTNVPSLANHQVKDVDLPIAMKYRNYRNLGKKVEVAPSHIHKNGLFATEE